MIRVFHYRCPEDGTPQVLEIRGATPETPITPTCEQCGADMKRVYTPPATHFFKRTGGGTR